MEHSDNVCVKQSPGRGRGVFARKMIRAGEVIERVPDFLIPFKTIAAGRKNPTLAHYFYEWNRTHAAVSLGYGSLYNHSYKPNAVYRHGQMAMIYAALRDIAPGEEITVNYNGHPDGRAPMIFEVVESKNGRRNASKNGQGNVSKNGPGNPRSLPRRGSPRR